MADPNMDIISHTYYKDVSDFESFVINTENFLKVFHINIRSLNKNHNHLVALLESLSIKFDIIILSELWVVNIDLYLHILLNYSFVYQINPLNQASGIGAFISSKLTYLYDTNTMLAGSEYLNITLKSTQMHSLHDLVIHCIYRHPGPLHKDFLPNLESLIRIQPKVKQIIIGDLNINILNNLCPMAESYLNLLSENQFLPLILSPTRITESSQTLIDHIMYNGFNETKSYSGNIYTDISDHLANYTLIPLVFTHKLNCDRPLIRITSKSHNETFRQQIANINLDYGNNTDNADHIFSSYYQSFQECFQNSFPKVKQSIKQYKLKPWLNKTLLKMIRRKNQLYKEWLTYGSSTIYSKYNEIKKLTRNQIFFAKQSYFQNMFSYHSKNVKMTWKCINEALGRKTIPTQIVSITYDNETCNNPQNIAKALNSHFCTTANKLHDTIPHIDFLYSGIINEHSFFIDPTCAEEIQFIIKSFQSKESLGGLDEFSIKYIKLVSDIIDKHLSYLFNLCIAQGIFPDILKISKVIPIYKNGPKNNPNNYRPIALQSCFSKILEKLIKSRLQGFIDKCNLLNKYQYGFRKESSTKLALLDLMQTIELNQNKDKHTIAIFLDLRKAFDTVNHELLLKKLVSYGFRGTAFSFFSSYLHNRKQFTHAMDFSSSIEEIHFGVPQGSILGPLLFLLYINDLNCPISEDITLKLFADDTVILISHSNLEMLNSVSNETINAVMNWLKMNKLSLNTEKTFGMYFSAKKKKKTSNWIPKIFLDNSQLKFVDHIKYLGLQIDSKLTFKEHVYYLLNKLRKWVSVFRKISPLLTLSAKYTVYNSLFSSNLLYGIELYGTADQSTIKHLQIIQNKAIKALFQYDRYHSTDLLFAKLGIRKINIVFKIRATCMLKVLLEQPAYLNVHNVLRSYCSPIEHKYPIRDKKMLYLTYEKPSFTSSNTFGLFLLWNSIPAHIKNINSYMAFKKCVTHHFATAK